MVTITVASYLRVSLSMLSSREPADNVVRELRGKHLTTLRRVELADFCSRLGLDNSGTRATLQARLNQAIRSHVPPPPATSLPSASQDTITTTSAALLSGGPVTVSSSSGLLLPPFLAHLTPLLALGHNITATTAATSLPASSTITGTHAPSHNWIQSIAEQAAQSAVAQAIALNPTGICIPPPNPPAATPQQPTQVSLVPSSQHHTTPIPALNQQVLPGGAATTIVGFNLPGELSGMLPHTIVTKILSLQYFDLSTLLPSNLATARDTQPVRVQLGGDDSQHLLLSRRPSSKKTISSIHDWVTTFSTYAAVITTADPTRGPDLFEYTRLVVQAEREYKGEAWLQYDIAFRTRAANRHITRWADIDSTLWNRAFSGLSRASSYCAVCLDSTHTTTECPLYTQGPAQRRSTSGAGPSQPNIAARTPLPTHLGLYASIGTEEGANSQTVNALTFALHTAVVASITLPSAQNADTPLAN